MQLQKAEGKYLPLAETYSLVRHEKRFKIYNSQLTDSVAARFDSIDGRRIITTPVPKIIHIEDETTAKPHSNYSAQNSYTSFHTMHLHPRIDSMERTNRGKILVRPKYEEHPSELNVYAKRLGLYPLRNKCNAHNTEIYRKNPLLFPDEWNNMQAVFETSLLDSEIVSKIFIVGSNPLITLDFLDRYLQDRPKVIV